MAEKTLFFTDFHKARLSKYDRYDKIFRGAHKMVFSSSLSNLSEEDKKKYIVSNFGGLISKVSADFLFSEPIIVRAKEGSSEDQQENIKMIVEDNKLHVLNWEMALVTSYKGGGVYKVRYGDYKSVGINSETKELGAIIEFVQPDYYFAVFDQDNVNIITEKIIAWRKTIDNKEYLRMERHYPDGRIVNELWTLKGDYIDTKVDLGLLYENPPAEEEYNGIDGYSIFYVPNFRPSPDSHYGQGDYEDLESLFEELNNRKSRNARILDKHSNPKMAVPLGVLDEDGNVRREQYEMFEVAGEMGGLNKPEYITWDGKLDAAERQIDDLIKTMFLVAEISPSVFGMDNGGIAESGRALKFRLMRTLSKIKRKKTYFEDVLKKVINAAQLFESNLGSGPVPVQVNIEFQDGIPTDAREEAEIREIEMRSGAISEETAVRERNPQWTDEEIEAELKRLSANKPSFGASPLAGGLSLPEDEMNDDEMSMNEGMPNNQTPPHGNSKANPSDSGAVPGARSNR